MNYTVEVYDNFDRPDERCCSKVGTFETVEEAIACAKSVVDESLLRVRLSNATDWYKKYSCSGDGTYILGERSSGFNPYDYAKSRIEQITGEHVKGWGEG